MKWLGILLDGISVLWEWIMYPKYMLWTTLFGIVFAVCIIGTPHPWNYVAGGVVLVIGLVYGPHRWS